MSFCFSRGPSRPLSKPLLWILFAGLPLACVADDGTEPQPAPQAQASSDTGQESDAGSSDKKYYDVDCSQTDENGEKVCITDKATYVGWRTFHANCHVCHGQNAVGSSFAPSLIKHIDKDVFVNTVTNGKTGQIGVMPAWGKNPNVKDFIDELYAYQQARADGVLLPGRPKKKD